MSLLRKEQIIQQQDIKNIRKHLAHYITLDVGRHHQMDVMISDVKRQALATQHGLQRLAGEVISKLDEHARAIEGVAVLSRFTEIRGRLSAIAYGQLPYLYSANTQLLTDMRAAQRGVLSHSLIKPSQLEKNYQYDFKITVRSSP